MVGLPAFYLVVPAFEAFPVVLEGLGQGLQYVLQYGLYVAHYGDIDFDIFAYRGRVDVYVDYARVGRELVYLSGDPVVDARADRYEAVGVHYRHVGAVRAVHAEHAHEEGLRAGERSEAHERGRRRQAHLLAKREELPWCVAG